MSNEPIIQYRGFAAKSMVREYSFNVRDAGIDRAFTLNIANEAFVSHQARYQDAPSICALRLNAELAAHANHPPDSDFAITPAELDEYRVARAPKPTNSFSGYKKPQDDF